MSPGDTFARATGVYVVVALVGRTAAVVPIARGHARSVRGDVPLCPLRSGVPVRQPAARCRARQTMTLAGEPKLGAVSSAELSTITRAIRQCAETEMLERKYGASAMIQALAPA